MRYIHRSDTSGKSKNSVSFHNLFQVFSFGGLDELRIKLQQEFITLNILRNIGALTADVKFRQNVLKMVLHVDSGTSLSSLQSSAVQPLPNMRRAINNLNSNGISEFVLSLNTSCSTHSGTKQFLK